MRLSWNLLAGFTGSFWTAIAGVLATPFYLHYLGIESFGLIGFFTTLLMLLQLLDVGLAPTMNREVARHAAMGNARGARHLLRSLELVYWAVGFILGLLVILEARWIGVRWLHSAQLAQKDVVYAVMLMGLVIAVRWPVGLYAGALMGAERLAVVSGINIIMVTMGAVGGILVLAILTPTIKAFFLWQAGVSLMHATVMRWAAWKALGGRRNINFRLGELHRIWRFSAGLGVITVTGVFLSQFDKLLLSSMVGLDAYGRYMLASMLASGLYLLVTPVFNVIYPRFSALVMAGETKRLVELYGLATRLVATLVFPLAVSVALFSQQLIWVWTHDPVLAIKAAPIAALLILGAALHGIMYLPYALQLAYGRARLALTINLVLIIVYVPLMLLLVLSYAEMGAALAWLLLHCCYLGFGTWLSHRHLLKEYGTHWLIHDVGIPLCASLVVAGGVGWSGLNSSGSGYEGLLLAGITAIIATLLSLLLSPALRSVLCKNLRLKLNQI